LVRYLLGQESPAETADAEILDGYQTELSDQSAGQLVRMVMPEVANPLMLPG